MSDKREMTQAELIRTIINRQLADRIGHGMPKHEVVLVGEYINALEAAVKAAGRQKAEGVWECECGGNNCCDWCTAMERLEGPDER